MNSLLQPEGTPVNKEEITRTRVALATGFFRLTLISPAWLADLTPEEFTQLHCEILPVLEQENKRRASVPTP